MSPNSRLARRVIRERKVRVKERLEMGRNIEMMVKSSPSSPRENPISSRRNILRRRPGRA